MQSLSTMPLLPLASGSNLLGLAIFFVVFVVVPIVKAVGKKMLGDESSPTPPPLPPGGARPTLEEEMRRLLEQTTATPTRTQAPMRKPPPLRPAQANQRPKQPMAGPSRNIIRPPLTHQRPARAAPAAALPPPLAPEPEIASPLLGKTIQTTIRQDISDSMESMRKPMESLSTVRAGSTLETEALSVQQLDMSMLRSRQGLKQAFLISEILGKPRALNPKQV